MKFKTLIINAEIAEEYGYPAAIMLHHISYWVEFNKINRQCKKDSVYWMYRTYEGLASEYPGMSAKTAERAINKLEEAKLVISKLFFVDNRKINHYRLSDKGKKFSANFRREGKRLFIDYEKLAKFQRTKSSTGADENVQSIGRNCLSIYNVKKKKGNNLRDSEESRAHAGSIVKILGTFAPLGTKVNYGDTTQRAAALRLIEKCGDEQAIMFAENAVRATQDRLAGNKYAPLIRNAYDLEKKLVNLANYLQRPVQEMVSIPESWRSILED